MANDIDKTSPHYKGEFGSIYEVNQKFPSGGVEGDYVAIDGWAHYWNADRGTWCVNAQRDSYWDELITNIIEKFKLVRGATYMGVASLDTVPAKVVGAKMYYFATVAGTYKNFGGLVVPQGINVLYSENGSSWVCSTLLEVAQELGLSTWKVVSQKALNDALELKANQSAVNEALEKKADKKTMDIELGKKFDKTSVAQESGDSEELVMSQKAVSEKFIELSNILRVTTNKEYAFALTDVNGKLAFGIKRSTGDFVFGIGVPSEIRTFVLKLFGKIEEDFSNRLNEVYEDLSIKNDDKIEKTSDIIKVVSNKEYAFALTDALNKILLAISPKNGFLQANGLKVEDALIKVVSNKEYAFALTDVNGKLAFGIKRSTGDFDFGGGVPSKITKYLNEILSNYVTKDEVEKINNILGLKETKIYSVDDFLPHQIDFGKANIGDTYDFLTNVGNSSNYKHIVLNIQPYSKIKVTATGGLSPRTYGFFDSEKRLLAMAGESEVLQNSILIAPASAFYLVVNANITSNPAPTAMYPADNLSVDIANANEKTEATYEINSVCENIESYVNGLQFRKELLNHVADLKKEGDKMVHVSTFCIINDVLYATYYVNTINYGETPSEHTARFVICPLNTISDSSTYKYYDLCYTKTVAEANGIQEILINGKHIDYLYDIVLLRKDDNTLFLAWTCTLDDIYYRVYKTYDISTQSFSDIAINKFKISDTVVDFSSNNLNDVFAKYNIEHKPLIGDIGIMQKLSSRIESGVVYYYTGMYIGQFNCIIKSTDLMTWEFVSIPSFENKSQWENAVYIKNDKAFYFCRQQYNTPYAFLTWFDLSTNKWHSPIYINDGQSRYDFIEYNNKLYLIHSPMDRNHLAIMLIDEDNLIRSKDVQVAQVPDYFYPYMQKYKGELYISFTNSRQHIYVSKFTICSIDSDTIRDKFNQMFNI